MKWTQLPGRGVGGSRGEPLAAGSELARNLAPPPSGPICLSKPWPPGTLEEDTGTWT